jgi:hypothetical protein
MKTYIQFITEKKDHIINKIPNLTSAEKKEVIKFFKKKPNLENKIDWNNYKRLTWHDFEELMKETKSEKRRKEKKLRHKGIKGLIEGEDYININTKNKYYLTYAALNAKAAKVMASETFGGINCRHNGCIGSSQAIKYFKSEAKKKKRVPIMVLGSTMKYWVMMYPNGDHETWDASNQKGKRGETIPGFNIEKELNTPSLRKLYQEIIDDVWKQKLNVPSKVKNREGYDDALIDYEDMVNEIENYMQERIDAVSNYYENNKTELENAIMDYQNDIIPDLEEEIQNSRKALNQRENLENKLAEIKEIIKTEPTGTGTNSQGEVVWNLNGVDYTLDELSDFHKHIKDNLDTWIETYFLNNDIKELEKELEKEKENLEGLIYLRNDESYGYELEEFVHKNNIDIDIMPEDYIFEGLYAKFDFGQDYDNYFEYMEEYDESFENYLHNRRDYMDGIYESETEIAWSNEEFDGEEFLSDIGLLHPSEIGTD